MKLSFYSVINPVKTVTLLNGLNVWFRMSKIFTSTIKVIQYFVFFHTKITIEKNNFDFDFLFLFRIIQLLQLDSSETKR